MSPSTSATSSSILSASATGLPDSKDQVRKWTEAGRGWIGSSIVPIIEAALHSDGLAATTRLWEDNLYIG